MYTDDFIKDLIGCEKNIVDPPSRDYKEERGHLKKNFTLQSIDGNFSFNAFIRFSVHFNENFSIGLDYNPREEKGTVCLVRCNGAHGESIKYPHHSTFHIHKANALTVNSGLKPESNIEETKEYATLNDAIQYFVKFINISVADRKRYFPTPDTQTSLSFDE